MFFKLRLFDATSKGRVFNSPSNPAISIWTNEDGQLISAEMPGIHPDDLDIDVTGDALSISGERKPDGVASEVLKPRFILIVLTQFVKRYRK